MKRVFAILFGLIVLMFCASAFADTGMEIKSAKDFVAFTQKASENPALNAYLSEDVDLKGETSFAPVPHYSGTFEGNGFTISGLNAEGEACAVFLEIAEGGRVQNLGLSGSISGTNAAALAVVNRGTVQNVISYAEVYARSIGAGIVCENRGELLSCENRGTVYALGGAKGAGIAGLNYAILDGCANHGCVDGSLNVPYAEAVGGICAESFAGSSVTNCINAGSILCGEYGAGMVCFAYEAEIRENRNFGDVISNRSNPAGIASRADGGSIVECVNYGDVICEQEYSAGIAANGGADIVNCSNHGAIHAGSYAAGVAANWFGSITNCENYGEVSAENYAGGICSLLSGTALSCKNNAAVTGEMNYTAGVVSELLGGSISHCSNSGHVKGGNNGWYIEEYTGGIVGSVQSADAVIADVCNTGTVECPRNNCGGIAGHLAGMLRNAVNSGSYSAVGTLGDADITDLYNVYEDGVSKVDPSIFYSGELAWRFNTNNGKGVNSCAWSQTTDSPVLADSLHLPTRMYVCSYRDGEEKVFSGEDGKVQAPSGYVLYDYVCIDENGVEIPSDELFREAEMAGAEKIVYVDDAWSFASAMNGGRVEEIHLTNDIVMDCDLYLTEDRRIVGNGHRIDMGKYYFDSNADITISNLSMVSDGGYVAVGNGSLRVEGFLETTASIENFYGYLDLQNGKIINKREAEGTATIIDKNAESYPGYTRTDAGFRTLAPQKYFAANELVAPAKQNKSLSYDIYPEIRDGVVYFFLPCNAKADKITVCTANASGEILETCKNMDLREGSGASIRIFGMDYPVVALQSDLPTLSFDINENFGTIDAMNGSADHSVFCYGDVRLDVSDKLQKEKKWTSFKSTENDNTQNGTMRIRGRGNSTWSAKLDTKKPYQFKMEKKQDVLGMGKHKTWILLMNDEHLVRNKLGLDLAQDIGLSNSSMGEFVDVFMNGRYLGNYLLCERVEISKERVNIAKLDTEFEDNRNSVTGLDLSGGYLLEFDNWGGDTLQIFHEASGNTISVKEPEDLEISVSEYNSYGYIYSYMRDFLNAVYGDGTLPDGRSYLDMIDQNSFARYFFHQEFLMNGDCGRGSTFMYKDRDSIDPLLHAGPVWDHDRIYEGEIAEWIIPGINQAGTDQKTIYNQLSHRAEFVEILLNAYETTDIPEALANASRHIDTYEEVLKDSARMNSIRWQLPDFDIEWLRYTMDARAAWIAENYRSLADIAE